ncbi:MULTISPECIES: hypothetical protein [Vibrio harveyi group]|uniref:Uncharacterized protein n=1 Tax=Vibrio campbellii TaxID=680 RepID=A0AAQ3B1V0_9VIBR|nr:MULTISPECIES: hypothetical protein [Vibrio harveyi group]EHE7894254.1 hypothetical protein [Vibrio parahaemolyticus]EJE4227730.1 hypothetical protein [Vibrio parahaemolyticus]EKI0734755.1 hypothetical protein [Vibrio parahaemolyticus]MBE4144357.1 hypothetical protein [Vibrio parahaemolyticus]MCS0065146.1 hypothetical protein [Vibrio parahaemolyticus]
MQRHGSFARLLAFNIIILFGFMTLIGCSSTTNTKPFLAFQNSAESLRDGSDAAIDLLIPMTSARFEADKSSTMAEFMDAHEIIVDKTKGTYVIEKAPLYLEQESFKLGLYEMNNTMVGYANVLLTLSGKDAMSEDEFTKKVNELNANGFAAYLALKGEPKDENAHSQAAENSGIFSTAAILAFDIYLEGKKDSELIAALEENQSQIELFSGSFISAIGVIEVSLENEYNQRVGTFSDLFVENRSAATKQYMTLNRTYYAQLNSLKALRHSAESFPKAHSQLVTAVKSPGEPMTAVLTMMNYGKQLKTIADDAKKTNEQLLVERNLEPAQAQVDVLNAESIAANHEYAKVQVQAVAARIAADSDPSDVEKTKVAGELEKKALDLKVVAEQKATAAQKMREAVDALITASAATLN